MKVQTLLATAALLVLNLACSLSTPPSAAASNVLQSTAPEATETLEEIIPAVVESIQTTEIAETHSACIVTANALHLRTCPGLDCAVADWLNAGTELIVLGTSDNWLNVKTQSGRSGWVNGKYCGGKQ